MKRILTILFICISAGVIAQDSATISDQNATVPNTTFGRFDQRGGGLKGLFFPSGNGYPMGYLIPKNANDSLLSALYFNRATQSLMYYNSVTKSWRNTAGGSGGGTGSPNTSVGGGYVVAKSGSNVVRTLIPGFGFAIDSATNTLNLRVDSTRVVPVPLTLIAGGALTWDGAGWRTKQSGLSDALTNDNCYTSNGYQICITGNGIQITDTATGTQNFVFGTNGMRNDYYNDGTGIARMVTVTNGVYGYQNIPTSGGGGGTGKNYYAGQGLILNDSVFAVNNAYFDGRYVSLTGTYNNPTWLNTLAYSKLTGVPDFIPLTGTQAGKPVTGDIFSNAGLYVGEFQSTVNGVASIQAININGNQFVAMGDLDAAFQEQATIIASSGTSGEPSSGMVYLNASRNILIGVNPSGKGIVGSSYYGANYDPNTYVQMRYVDSAIAAHTSDSGGRTYYAQEPIYKANDSTFAIRQASGSQAGALSAGDYSTFSAKEPAIAAGTTSQYWRGDKTFQTLNTTAVPEGSNLYHTPSRAQSAIAGVGTGLIRSNGTTLTADNSTYLNSNFGTNGSIIFRGAGGISEDNLYFRYDSVNKRLIVNGTTGTFTINGNSNSNTADGLQLINSNAGSLARSSMYTQNNIGVLGGIETGSSNYGNFIGKNRTILVGSSSVGVLTDGGVSSGGTHSFQVYVGGAGYSQHSASFYPNGHIVFAKGDSTDVYATSNPNITVNVKGSLHADTLYGVVAGGSGGGSMSYTTYNDATTGSYTIPASNSFTAFNPGATVPTKTIVLPSAPVDGQICYISFGGTVAQGSTVVNNLTIAANAGQSLLQAYTPSSMLSGETIWYWFKSAISTWYRGK